MQPLLEAAHGDAPAGPAAEDLQGRGHREGHGPVPEHGTPVTTPDEGLNDDDGAAQLRNHSADDMGILGTGLLLVSGPATAFVSAIVTRIGDDVTFKFLCDAFPTGLQFFFLSTISPVILAAVMVLMTTMANRCNRSSVVTGDASSKADNVGELSESSTGGDDAAPGWSPWKLSRSHAAIAALDQLVTLLATAGGPRTPGYAQVIINQSMVPLTALASRLIFGRNFQPQQIAASSLIVMGSIFAGLGVLSDDYEDHDDSNDRTDYAGTKPGVAVSVALFSSAQIPNAIAHVWREQLLKSEDRSRGVQNQRCPMPMRILRLATSINLVRAGLSLFVGAVASLASPAIAAAMSQGFQKMSANLDHATQLVVLNTVAWIASKLSILWVSGGKGGAFLSSIAGAVSLPLEIMAFHIAAAESPNSLALLGLIISLVGLIAYFKAAPGEFTLSAPGGLLSTELFPYHSPEGVLDNEEDASSLEIPPPRIKVDKVEAKRRSHSDFTEDTGERTRLRSSPVLQ